MTPTMSDTPSEPPIFPETMGPSEPAQSLLITLLLDQRLRWRRGERILVETYLEQRPALRDDVEGLLDLVSNEVWLRERNGEAPRLDEYLQRFPQLADQLRVQFEVDRALRAADPPASTPEARTPDLRAGQGNVDRTAAPWPSIPGYEILSVLGQGGMGIAYKALQIRLRRVVALKMLRPGDLPHPEQLARFKIEAEAIGRLRHPHIVPIYDVGEQDGRPFYVMEYVEGGSLHQQLGGTPWPAPRAAPLVEALARAIHAVHECGIVHRDLKPGNVLLDADGSPRITDFGLAKFVGGEPGLTQTGAILGTPSYMAPEQASSSTGAVGPAADVYALGSILYELLTGRPPFKAESSLATLHQVVSSEPVPVCRLQPNVPHDLETICLKCLAKEPARRYASAAELAEELGRFHRDEPIHARPLGAPARLARWCRRNPALAAVSVLALAALIATAGLAVWFGVYQYRAAAELQDALQEAQAQRRAADRSTASATYDRGLTLCEQGDVDRGLLWLADSLRIATRAEHADLERVIRTSLAGWGQSSPALRAHLVHRDWIRSIAFSPDGDRAATGSLDHRACLWETASGRLIAELLHDDVVQTVAFSSDGQLLLTTAGREAHLWDGTSGRALSQSFTHPSVISTAVFSPRGNKLLLAGEDGVAQLWQVDSGGRAGACLVHQGRINAVAFSPDGHLLVTGSADHTACLWDTEAGTCLHRWTHRLDVLVVAFSPDEQTVLTGSVDETARLWQISSGQEIGSPLKLGGPVEAMAFSSDGRTLALGCKDWKVYLWRRGMDAFSGDPQLLFHLAPVTSVAFSPDGRMLATGSKDGLARVWEVETGNLLSAPLQHLGEVDAVSFNPNGRTILTAGREPSARLWRIAPTFQNGKTFPGPSWVSSLAFSPDGRLMALGGDEGTTQVWDIFSGQLVGPPLPHHGILRGLAFNRDGTMLVVASEKDPVYVWDLPSGRLRTELAQPGENLCAVVLGADDRTLLTGTLQGTVSLWDLADSQRRGSLRAHQGPVWALAFSPDGESFATGGADHTARLWKTATCEPYGPLLHHQGQIWSVVFQPDGRAVATGSEDKTARLWDTATGAPLGAPFQNPERIRSLMFRPDGATLWIGSENRISWLYDVGTRKPVGIPLRHSDTLLASLFTGGGSQVQSAGEDRVVRVLAMMPTLEGDVEQIALWVEVITGLELEEGQAVRVLDAAAWQTRQSRLLERGGPPRFR
jgi:WD40 repeat protein